MSQLSEPLDHSVGLTNERILDWEDCLNARDTGGLTTADGRHIRPGALARSDVLTRLSERGQRALIEHGVRTILDIRTPPEVARDWHAYPFGHLEGDQLDGVSYLNVSFTAGHDEHAWDMVKAHYAAALTREELNRLDIDNYAAGIAGIAAAVAEARPGGVLIHCHAGKDRTGLSVAMLLSAVGVDDQQVSDDYALSYQSLDGQIAEWLDEMSDDPAERARLRALSEPRAGAMADTLEYVRRRYGSAADYLESGGLRGEQLDSLRRRLVEQ